MSERTANVGNSWRASRHRTDVPPAAAAPSFGARAIVVGLSLLRLVLAALFPFVNRVGAIVILFGAALTDGLDGLLARRWKATSLRGALLDAASDKVFLWTALGTLAVRGVIPPWLLMLLLIRDLVIVPAAVVAGVTGSRSVLEELDHPLSSRIASLAMYVFIGTQLALPQMVILNNVIAGLAVAAGLFAAVSYLSRLRQLGGATVRREPELEKTRK